MDDDKKNDQVDNWQIPFKSDGNNEESLASKNDCCQRVEQTWEEKGVPEIFILIYQFKF